MSDQQWKPPHINQDDCEHITDYCTYYGGLRSPEVTVHTDGAFCVKCGKDMRGPPKTAEDYGKVFTIDRKDITYKPTPLQIAMKKASMIMNKKFFDQFKDAYLNDNHLDRKEIDWLKMTITMKTKDWPEDKRLGDFKHLHKAYEELIEEEEQKKQ